MINYRRWGWSLVLYWFAWTFWTTFIPLMIKSSHSWIVITLPELLGWREPDPTVASFGYGVSAWAFAIVGQLSYGPFGTYPIWLQVAFMITALFLLERVWSENRMLVLRRSTQVGVLLGGAYCLSAIGLQNPTPWRPLTAFDMVIEIGIPAMIAAFLSMPLIGLLWRHYPLKFKFDW